MTDTYDKIFTLTADELHDIILKATEHGAITFNRPKGDTLDAVVFGHAASVMEELASKQDRKALTLPQSANNMEVFKTELSNLLFQGNELLLKLK